MASINFLKDKECKTVTGSFKKYMAWLLRQKGVDVKRIRMDNGGEYMGKEFREICEKLGIAYETTSPHTVGNKTIWMFGSFGLCIEYIFWLNC